MSIENFKINHEIRELCNGTKRFAVKLNRLPPENRPIVEGTLKYALARWNQLEIRLRKEPGLAQQFTDKFEELLAQGTIEYEGTLKELREKFESTQILDEENVLLPLQIVLSPPKHLRLVFDLTTSNTFLYAGKLLLSSCC